MIKRISLIPAILFGAFWVAPSTAGAQHTTTPASPEALRVARGEQIFNATCAQSMCHGTGGMAGGAPQLKDRGLTAAYIEKVVTYGISGTAMAAWGQAIPQGDLEAVITYVESLNGIAPSARRGPPPVLTGEAEAGAKLFSDATMFPKCSNCHSVNEKGVPVAHPITTIPANAQELRTMTTPQVQTATVNGETFPALVAAQIPDEKETTVYDFTVFPPVLHTFPSSEMSLKDGSSWQHSSVLGTYSDSELDSILAFLRATKE